jgi:hypothetical protein
VARLVSRLQFARIENLVEASSALGSATATCSSSRGAAVEAPPFHFLVLYGISANRRALWVGAAAARAHIGYAPQDDAEAFARELEGKAAPGGEIATRFHGGSICALGFTGDPGKIG